MKKKFFVLITGAFIFSANIGIVFSQGQVVTGGAVPEEKDENQMQWLWGEVISVDSANNALAVKYLDFETDSEKEIIINVDEATAYENLKSLNEIKPGDNVSIDYIVGPQAKNVAKNIILEKPEATAGPEPVLQEAPEVTPIPEEKSD